MSLAAIILRQPKRKEDILNPVWGRMAYWSRVGRPQDGAAAGPVVMLEALSPSRTQWRQKSASPADAAELDRLAADGHFITTVGSRILVESTLEAIRTTQLYRTLPHEIGHLVDYSTKVPQADEARGISFDRHLALYDKFWQRPGQEREAFAHRYANEIRDRLSALGHIPFTRVDSWDSDGLRSCDFELPLP